MRNNKNVGNINDLNVNDLIHSAYIYAINSYRQFLEEIKLVKNSNLLSFWDYLITIACIGTSYMVITTNISVEDKIRFDQRIQKELDNWKDNSYYVMNDFLSYVNNLLNSKIEFENAVGGWVWVNIEKDNRASQELKMIASSLRLVGLTGALILGFNKGMGLIKKNP